MGVLDDIVAGVREDLAPRIRATPLATLQHRLADVSAAIDPVPAFRAPGVSVIAEVKRSSPSKGALATIADPAGLAAEYAAGGATAISVLTEPRRFNGTLGDLVAVRQRVPVAVLRKDFIVTEYQLVEARTAGADMALLIVAALDDAELRDLLDVATGIGLTPLVEVHDEAEVERAVAADVALIGVNNRNLQTLQVDPAHFARLAPKIPDDVITVAESGIASPEDVRRCRDLGAGAALIGEALVTHGSPRFRVAEMIAAGADNT